MAVLYTYTTNAVLIYTRLSAEHIYIPHYKIFVETQMVNKKFVTL